MPDPVFGEKVCLYAELVDAHTIDLPGLVEFLLASGVSKELLPERLIVVDELPRSSGGKVAKGELGKKTGKGLYDWKDGNVVKASATEHEDLYWAARGCGPGMFAEGQRQASPRVPHHALPRIRPRDTGKLALKSAPR